MATSTYMTYLMKKTAGTPATWSKVLDIKDYPDMGGVPEFLDCTTLSDDTRWGVPGLKSNDRLVFTANYDESTASNKQTALEALVGKKETYALWFGADSSGNPDGSQGKLEFDGYLDWHITGKGVNEVRELEIGITPASGFSYTAPSA